MERAVITESDAHLIVLEFLSCADLVRSTDMLCGGLGIIGSNLADINNVASGKPLYYLLKLVVEKWISQSGDDATIDALANILNQLGFKKTADAIRQNPVVGSAESSIWYGVPNSVPNFIGREEELQKIQEFFDNSAIEKSRKVMVISGLGGLGKSELAKMVAKIFESPLNNVVWIVAENYQMLSEGFKSLASKELNLRTEHVDGTEIDVRKVVESVYKSLGKKSSLVIFDNDESFKQNEKDDLYNFLPESFNFRPSFNFPKIVVTTRCADFIPYAGKIELECFSPPESRLFVRENLICLSNEIDVAKLSEVIQYFPLALQQAVAYINQATVPQINYGVQDYLVEFQKKAEHLLSFEFPYDSRITYAKTTMITWAITLEKIRNTANFGKLAIAILEIIAYLAPDNIEVSLLQQLMTTDENSNLNRSIQEGLIILRKYTMIKFHNGIANVHRLVQQVTRLQMEKSNTQMQTITSIMTNFATQLDLQSLPVWNIPHFISSWKNCNVFPELTIKFKALPATAVQFLHARIKWKEAILFGNEALSALLAHLPENETNVLNLKYALGGVLLKMGNTDMAIHYFTEVLMVREDSIGSQHPDTLELKHCIGRVHQWKGRFDKALQIHQEVLGGREAALGINHPETITTIWNIGIAYQGQQNFVLAMRAFEKVLNAREVTLGIDHPDTVDTRFSVGLIYHNRGYYNRALEIYEEVLRKREKALGRLHPDTLDTRHNIAAIYHHQRNHDRALNIYEDVLNARQKVMGMDHPDSLGTRFGVARIYYNQRNYDRALEICEEVLRKRVEALGVDHPDTLRTKYRAAKIYHKQGNYDSAIEMYEEVIREGVETFGIDYLDTIRTRQSFTRLKKFSSKYICNII